MSTAAFWADFPFPSGFPVPPNLAEWAAHSPVSGGALPGLLFKKRLELSTTESEGQWGQVAY